MLNIFPVQFLASVAYAILRLCVGFILIRLGILNIRSIKYIGEASATQILKRTPLFLWFLTVLEIVAGGLLILGAYTQIASLFALVFSFGQMVKPSRGGSHSGAFPRMFFLLLFCASLSLFITGAGIFAFDLPI